MKFATFLGICYWGFCLVKAEFRPISVNGETTINKKELASMNLDCQLEFLEQLRLVELMDMAKTSTYYEGLVANVFKRKYAKKTFMISDSFEESMMMPPFDREIVQININMAANILSTFGHMMEKVLINYNPFNETQSRKINEYVSNYCSESLIELYFYGCTENPLIGMPKQFQKVKAVSFVPFGGKMVPIGNETHNINDFFPELQRLHLVVEYWENADFINLAYPYLKELKLGLMVNSIDVAVIEELLTKNSQIQGLELKSTSLLLLKKVNDIVPNLEKLSYDVDIFGQNEEFNYEGEIRFKNVKRLSISFSEIPLNVVFDQLEEVEFDNNVHDIEWISIANYFGRFPTIKRFNATINCMGGVMNTEDLPHLLENLPNLVELGFFVDKALTVNHLTHFFESNKGLTKIFLIVSPENFTDDFYNELKQEFKVWNGRQDGWGLVTVERKPSNLN